MIRKYLLSRVLCIGIYEAQIQVLISLLFGAKPNSDKLEFGLDGGLNLLDQSGLNINILQLYLLSRETF
ncbi:MAG TPA: hypothetical protein PLJ60_14220 [Chryseolinea sp.]|nr:hypothetical protein [Chryseolinea sp.]HPM31488.1 hypothetical protein [Chryseolinea sp.]